MTRLTLIRHCETTANVEMIFQGHIDCGISQKGKRQLEKLRARFLHTKFDAVYTSPLKRAILTARAAAAGSGLEPALCPGLIEISGGVWEGLKLSDLTDRYPEQSRVWREEPWNFSIEGGEPMRAVYDRVWKAVLELVRKNPGASVCAVSHVCAIRNFLCRASGRPIEKLQEIPWVGNTAVNIIEFDANLKPDILAVNDLSHLDGEPASQKYD